MEQSKGDLVILAPHAYHFGYNSGLNLCEAVNFIDDSWVPHGLLAKFCPVHKASKKNEANLPMELFVHEAKHEW